MFNFRPSSSSFFYDVNALKSYHRIKEETNRHMDRGGSCGGREGHSLKISDKAD